MSTKQWIPEIMYEEGDDGLTSAIPFIRVPENEVMPKLLFIFESQETGEFEPGPEGEALPVTQLDLHQFVDMQLVKKVTPPEVFDSIRVALGLEPLATAAAKGTKVTENIRKKLNV